MIRAFVPWPIAWCKLDSNLENKNLANRSMKFFKAELVEVPSEKNPGSIFSKNGMLLFATVDPMVSLRVHELQIESKSKMTEKDFLNGIGRNLPLQA
jgi:methionyl-tRNA formyltransferase